MKVYAPLYYKRFKCIADKCKNSCCIGWEIDIDDESYAKYLSVGGRLKEHIAEADGCRYFRLKNGRCPHLLENGLCEIIINYGESYLTEICREHPRFYNNLKGRREAGLGLVCEEAARLIITDTDIFSLEKIGECAEEHTVREFNALPERDAMINVLLLSNKPLPEKIKMLESRYSVDTRIHSIAEWLDIISELEMLDNRWDIILKEAINSEKKHDICDYYSNLERVLIYFIYRHVCTASSYLNLRSRLGFSLLSVNILAYLFERAEACNVEALIELARLYSSEIEYSEENIDALIFEFESNLID